MAKVVSPKALQEKLWNSTLTFAVLPLQNEKERTHKTQITIPIIQETLVKLLVELFAVC